MFGMSDMTLAFEGTYGAYLRSQGHHVDYLLCNSGLKNCIFDSKNYLLSKNNLKEHLNRRIKCAYCSLNAKRSFEAFGFKDSMTLLSDYKSYSVPHVDLSEHAKSTTLRNLLIGEFDHDLDSVSVYNRYLISAEALYSQIDDIFTQKNIDTLICVHGIYLEHGVLVDVARKHNVNIYVYGFPYRSNTFTIFAGDTYHRAIWKIPKASWVNQKLSEKAIKVSYDYLLSKTAGGRDVVNYHPKPLVDRSLIVEMLNIGGFSKVTTFFTNVLWDANIFYGDSLFEKGIVDATIFLINEFARNPSELLLIRIHPAESKGGFTTRKSFSSIIKENFDILPQNIRVIGPESDISSYTLAEMSDKSIIYGSNIGLELACRGHSVIVIGEAFIKGAPFVQTPISLEHLKNLLFSDNSSTNSQENISLAIKYFYFLNFKISIDLEILEYSALDVKNIYIKDLKKVRNNNFATNNFIELERQMSQGLQILDYSKFNCGIYE